MPESCSDLGAERQVEVIDGTCPRCSEDGRGTYLTEAKCRNCGWSGQMLHSLTHSKTDRSGTRCPVCECRKVMPGEFMERVEARALLKEGERDA